jgi:hypothetical protein
MRVSRFSTFGVDHIWAMAVATLEGSEAPQHILVSQDAGKTWDRTQLPGFGLQGGFAAVDEFRFFDATHGIASIRNMVGRGKVFQSIDGGKTWPLLWETWEGIDVEETPRSFSEPDPPSAAVWEKRSDFHKVTGTLRLLDEDKGFFRPYRVQRRLFDEDWVPIASIPRIYVEDGGKLKPKAQ